MNKFIESYDSNEVESTGYQFIHWAFLNGFENEGEDSHFDVFFHLGVSRTAFREYDVFLSTFEREPSYGPRYDQKQRKFWEACIKLTPEMLEKAGYDLDYEPDLDMYLHHGTDEFSCYGYFRYGDFGIFSDEDGFNSIFYSKNYLWKKVI